MTIDTQLDPPAGAPPTSPAQRATFRNPLLLDGADPWLTWHAGWYYLATTTAVDVRIRRARRLGDLRAAPEQLVSPDGSEDWIAYHAKPGTAISYADRSSRAQPFTWDADGTPHFGEPLPLDAELPVPSGEPAAEGRDAIGHGDNAEEDSRRPRR